MENTREKERQCAADVTAVRSGTFAAAMDARLISSFFHPQTDTGKRVGHLSWSSSTARDRTCPISRLCDTLI